MKTVEEIRHANLLIAIERAGTIEALAERSDCNAAYLSQVKNGLVDSKTGRPRTIGTRLARMIERGLNEPRGWMDRDQSAQPGIARGRLSLVPPGGQEDPTIAEIVTLLRATDREGRIKCLGVVQGILSQHVAKESPPSG